MGLFSRLMGWKTSPITPTITIDRLIDMANSGNVLGAAVNEKTALAVSTVYACSRIICEAVGQTPLLYYSKDKEGFLDEDTKNSLHYLLSVAPNDMETASAFLEGLVHNQLFSGKAFTYVSKASGPSKEILEFLPISPNRVRINRDLTGNPYQFVLQTPGGKDRILSPESLIYHKAYRETSVLSATDTSIGLMIMAERHEGNVLKKGARIRGLLKLKGRHDPEELMRRGKDFDEAFGGNNAEQTAVISIEEDYVPISMTNSDLQLVATKDYSRADICAAFRVPLYMVTGTDAPSNMEAEARRFYVQCLGPIFRRIELDFKKYLTDFEIAKKNRFDVQFDTGKYLEADAKTVAYVNDTYLKNGVRSPDEIRRTMNLKPREDGNGGNFIDITEVNTGLVNTSGSDIEAGTPPDTEVIPENEGTLNGNE